MYEVPSGQCNDAGTGGLLTPSTPLNAAGTISPWPAVETPLVGSNAPGQHRNLQKEKPRHIRAYPKNR